MSLTSSFYDENHDIYHVIIMIMSWHAYMTLCHVIWHNHVFMILFMTWWCRCQIPLRQSISDIDMSIWHHHDDHFKISEMNLVHDFYLSHHGRCQWLWNQGWSFINLVMSRSFGGRGFDIIRWWLMKIVEVTIIFHLNSTYYHFLSRYKDKVR